MKKLHIAIRNEIQTGNTLELYFLDGIYDYIDWSEWTVVNLVEDVINKVNAAKPSRIVMYINSEGGDCSIGLAIYNFLKYMTGCEIESRMLGLAASIASVIPQASTPGKRYIARNGFMVIHKAWGYGMGNADEMRQQADVIDSYTATIVDIYAQQTGKTADEIAALIANGDYWMTGTQAVEMGFADATFDDMPEGFGVAACVNRGLDEHYTNTPEAVRKLLNSAPGNSGAPSNAHQNPTDTMTWKEKFFASFRKNKIDANAPDLNTAIENALAGPLDELEQSVRDSVAELMEGERAAITTDVTNALNTRLTALETANANLNTALETANATIERLTNDNADRQGNESGRGAGASASAEKPIGYGIKAATSSAS